MSYNISINASLTTMMTAQYNTAVASANIANADTDGYTAKSASNQTQVVGGQAVGVQAGQLSSNLDAKLLEKLNDSASDAGYAATMESYLALTGQSFGSVSGDDTISEQMSAIEAALTTLGTDPVGSSNQYDTVQTFTDLALELNSLSKDIQQQRSDADTEIGALVDQANSTLENIDKLNDQIAAAKARGDSTADLEDQRNTALLELSEIMDISYFTDSAGKVNVYTTSGTALLTSGVHPLSYDPTTTVSPATSYPGVFDGITAAGKDITSEINGGKLGALVELRDETLPALQAELDQLSSSLISTVNAIANQGSAYPAPNSLTGTDGLTAADAFSGTGTVRIALTDSSGTVQNHADINLNALATVQDVINEINLIPGITASLNAQGQLQITASDPAEGAAINQMDSLVGTDSEGFSAYFGFNDIFSGSSAFDIAIAPDLAADTALFPGGILNDDPALAAGDPGVTSGDDENVQNLIDAFSGTQTFAAAGGLGAKNASFQDYAATIHSALALDAEDAADKAAQANDTYTSYAESLSGQSGVNLDEEIAKMNTYQQSYEAGAQVLSVLQQMFDALIQSVN